MDLPPTDKGRTGVRVGGISLQKEPSGAELYQIAISLNGSANDHVGRERIRDEFPVVGERECASDFQLAATQSVKHPPSGGEFDIHEHQLETCFVASLNILVQANWITFQRVTTK